MLEPEGLMYASGVRLVLHGVTGHEACYETEASTEGPPSPWFLWSCQKDFRHVRVTGVSLLDGIGKGDTFKEESESSERKRVECPPRRPVLTGVLGKFPGSPAQVYLLTFNRQHRDCMGLLEERMVRCSELEILRKLGLLLLPEFLVSLISSSPFE